jgi:transposase
MGDDTTSVTAALFGLAGFEILAAADVGGELELLVQTTADLVGCPACGAVARAKDRRSTWVRDLPLAGRAVVVCWVERIWSCSHRLCERRTWTEQHPAIARAGMTKRARVWSFEQAATRTRPSHGSRPGWGWRCARSCVRSLTVAPRRSTTRTGWPG